MSDVRWGVLLMLGAGCLGSPEEGGGPSEPVACDANLVANGTFEEGTSGWGAITATVMQVDGGVEGERAAEICYDGGGGDAYFSLDDNPNSVPGPATGEIYHLSAWVRAEGERPPSGVSAAVREFDAAGEPFPTMAFVSPGDSWALLEATLTVESADPEAVDVYLAVSEPKVGDCFQVDAICLQRE